MDWLTISVATTLTGTLLLALTQAYLYWQDRRRYLGIWALAWAVYAVRHGLMVLWLLGLDSPWVQAGNMLAVLGNALLLLWGARSFLGKPLHIAWPVATLMAAAWDVGVVFYQGPADPWRSMPNFALAGAAFLYTGFILWRDREQGRLGARLAGGAFFLWGLHKFDYPFLRPLAWAAPWGYLLAWLLELLVALGLVIAHFERVRRELRQAHNRLAASEERFRRLFNAGSDAVFMYRLGPDCLPGPFLEVNDLACSRLGYTRQELLGKTVRDISDDKVLPRLSDFYAKLLREGSAMAETLQRRKDGATIPSEVNVRLLEMDGERYVLSVSRDISERKAVERALRESENNYRTLVDNAADAIYLLQDGRIRLPNPAAARLTGYALEELEGRPYQEFIFPEDQKALETRYQGRLAGQELPTNYSVRVRAADGRVAWVQVNSVLVNWRGGPATLNIARDITYEHQLEEHLRQSQKLEAVGTLAGGIAHDFNNILASIIGYTELALRGDSLTETLKADLTQVLEAGFRARDLVRQILAFSRETEQDLKPLDVRLVVKESLKLLRASLPSSVEIESQISEQPCLVLADLAQVRQILVNLCSNAADALEEHGGVMRVELKTREMDDVTAMSLGLHPGDHVELVVTDNGPGMEPEILKRVFEPFFTTKGRTNNSGMGLSAVHGIARGLGGTLEAVSQPGRGSTFRVFLPRLTQESVQESGAGGVLPGGKERILVVDDEPGVVGYLERLLSDLGYRVTALTQSTLARELLEVRVRDYDLVITDQTMPMVSGMELAEMVHRLRPELPVILCSGFAEALPAGDELPVGVSAYLHKPIGSRTLAESVRRQLDREAPEER